MTSFELHNAAMRLSAEETVAVEKAQAYRHATDVEHLEARGRRAGFEVIREVDGQSVTEMRWLVRGHFRGRFREARLGISDLRVNESMTVTLVSPRFDVQTRLIFLADGPQSCRLRSDVAVAPRSISGRLLVPGLKLARGRLQRRLAQGLGTAARAIEIHNQTGSVAGHRAKG